MSNGKGQVICFLAVLIKDTLYKMSQYFPKPYETIVKVRLFLLT